MTKKQLEEYRSVIAEMDEVRERMRSNIVCDVVKGSDTQYPFTEHTIKVEGISDKVAYQRDTALFARLENQRRETEDFVHSIPDSETRRIFRMRYLDGEVKPSWKRIAFQIGGGNSADAVKKRVYRFITKKFQKK